MAESQTIHDIATVTRKHPREIHVLDGESPASSKLSAAGMKSVFEIGKFSFLAPEKNESNEARLLLVGD